MSRRNSTADQPTTIDGTTLLPVPTPPINLHDLEAVRREMARVYRDMRGRKIDTQDGTQAFEAASGNGRRGIPLLVSGQRQIRGFNPASYDAFFSARQ